MRSTRVMCQSAQVKYQVLLDHLRILKESIVSGRCSAPPVSGVVWFPDGHPHPSEGLINSPALLIKHPS